MSERVAVTIGIPFWNARRYLPTAVRSVFAQTHQDWELLLVDDGSADGSVESVRRLDDPRVRLVADGTHRGLCARLNQIASMARGTYLARMDADDVMHPERIARQLELLRGDPGVDLVDTAIFTVDDELTPRGIRGDRPLDARPEAVLRGGLLIHPTVTGRSEWFRRNPYDPVFVRAEDRELWVRTCATTRVARLCEPLFFYREGPAGNLANYLRTERTVREILRRYGPPLIGARRTRLLVMQSRLKATTYRVGTALGLQGRLIRRRNRPLGAAEMQEGRRILAAVQGTPVSGLEGGRPGPAPGEPLRDEAAA